MRFSAGAVPRRFFPQAEIENVVIPQAFQMVFVAYNHMIQQFVTAAANEPLRNAILPRASEASPVRLDTEGLYGIDYVGIEIRGPIKD